jgi:hypothetical protein
MEILLGALSILVLLGVIVPTAMASDVGDERDFIYGWRDAFTNWSFLAKYPNDDESHDDWYWQGVDAGWKYATHHVKVMVVQGHILTDLNATAYLDGWFDGQYAHSQGQPRIPEDNIFYEHEQGFYDGYDAPRPTLPAVASEHD